MSGTAPSRRNKVLLVDGDFRTSQRLAELLSQDGFEVEVVRDGTAAMARLGTSAPDTLITELRLPVGDGATVARYARERAPQLRVVVLTRYVNLVVPETFGSPPPAVLPKPLDYDRLLDILSGRDGGREYVAKPPSREF